MKNKRTAFAKTAVLLLAFAFPIIANSQTGGNRFPPNISQFTLKYQYHDYGDKYEYYLPNEQGDAWTKLVTVVRRPENAGHATISDLEEISTSVMELADGFPAEVSNLKDYAASGNIPDTRSFIVAYQIARVESNIWELELDLQKFFVKDGYVYVNLYAEKYQFSSAQALANTLMTRRPAFVAAQDAFVATKFPDAPSSSSVPTTPATTYTKITDTFLGSQPSTDQLTPQIQSILEQIAALRQKWNALQAAQTTTQTSRTTPAVSGAECPALFRSLSSGVRGDDVLSLQQFLITQGHLSSGLATGYFGPITRSAVERLQLAFGIFSAASNEASGYGIVGPRTRAGIALRCAAPRAGVATPPSRTCPLAEPPTTLCATGWRANTDSAGCVTSYKCAVPLPQAATTTSTIGACTAIKLLCPSGTYDQVGPNCSHTCVSGTTQPSSILFTTPTAGQVPLLVNFALSAADGSDSNGVHYAIEFGDGQATEFARTPAPSMFHTYASAGTYTATVTRRTACSSWGCSGSSTIIGTATITVGSTSPFSISSPTSGQSTQQGQGFTISWDSQNAPAGSAAAFWLVKSNGANLGLIARNQLPKGTL